MVNSTIHSDVFGVNKLKTISTAYAVHRLSCQGWPQSSTDKSKEQINPSFRNISCFSFFLLKLEAWFHATYDSMDGVLQCVPQNTANLSAPLCVVGMNEPQQLSAVNRK